MSARSSRKRDASSVASSLSQDAEQLDDVDTPGPPPTKKRASRSTASEKATKKAARMERNRIAAQASRDRKKNHTDYLESRIAELEAQLANSTSTPASSTSSTALTLLPSPLTHLLNLQSLPLGVVDPEVVRLKEENESLRTQLELEKLESKGLQLRLSSLEGKFGRLEKLLTQLSSGGGSIMSQQPESRQVVEVHNGNKTESSYPAADDVSTTSNPIPTDSFFSSSIPTSSSSQLDVQPFVPFVDNNELASSTSTFDFSFLDTTTNSTDFASNPLFDQNPSTSSSLSLTSFDAPIVDDSILSQAWQDWSSTVDLQPKQEEPEQENSFDLFEFLRKEQEGGAMYSGTEVVC
ncbi:hypothetical protein JCM3765_002164 [Sporobolomyces pararoseus]